jgi:hypothetical protein
MHTGRRAGGISRANDGWARGKTERHSAESGAGSPRGRHGGAESRGCRDVAPRRPGQGLCRFRRVRAPPIDPRCSSRATDTVGGCPTGSDRHDTDRAARGNRSAAATTLDPAGALGRGRVGWRELRRPLRARRRRCEPAAAGIDQFHPRSQTVRPAPLWFAVGESGQSSEMPPVGAGVIRRIELSQPPGEQRGQCGEQRLRTHANPGLPLATSLLTP